MESIVGTPEWDAATKKYAEALQKAADNGWKGWEHANCDHGYGYCATTPNNIFEPKGN